MGRKAVQWHTVSVVAKLPDSS